MHLLRSLQYLVLGATVCTCAYVVMQDLPETTEFLAQNTYFGPKEAVPNNAELIRIEVIIQDSPQLGGVRIEQASFDGHNIPMKTPDIYGHRGTASFQVMPGQYKLRWTVLRDTQVWPRTVDHEEIVHVSPRDLWVQITIEGEKATIE